MWGNRMSCGSCLRNHTQQSGQLNWIVVRGQLLLKSVILITFCHGLTVMSENSPPSKHLYSGPDVQNKTFLLSYMW